MSNRRNFFGALLGAMLAPFVKAAPVAASYIPCRIDECRRIEQMRFEVEGVCRAFSVQVPEYCSQSWTGARQTFDVSFPARPR